MDRTKFVVSFNIVKMDRMRAQFPLFEKEIYLSQIEKVYLQVFLQDLEDEERIINAAIDRVNDDEISLDALQVDIAAVLGLAGIEGIGMKRREKVRTVRV